ncbi:Zinc finger protein 287, partial [Araneus ventricosus]
THTN